MDQKQIEMQKSREITNPDLLPAYGNRRVWCRALGISMSSIRNATYTGNLPDGDIMGGEYFYTRKQILRWYAPALFTQLYNEDVPHQPES